MVTWSQSLTLAALEGKDEDTLSVLRDRLREACREVQLGQDALVFGSPDFKGKSIVSGAMWELPGLERLHFGAPCLRSAGDCLLPEEDPHAWLTGQGLYRLLVGMTDIACRLAEDPRESLTMQNSRVETVMGVGSRELRDGIRESERIVGSKISQIGSLVSLQVAAFVTTGVLALGIAFFVPLQLLSSHRRDMCRLAQVLSMLPQVGQRQA